MDGDVFAQGLDLDVGGDVDARVEHNTFDDVSGGDFPGEGVKIDAGDVSSLIVTGNNLLPPVGLDNAVSATVSAECNYWDSPSGPAPQGDGSEVVGGVDFEPWSVGRVGSGGNANTCRGGQYRRAPCARAPGSLVPALGAARTGASFGARRRPTVSSGQVVGYPK